MILENRNILGESPIWNHYNNKFYWVDILDKKIKSFDDVFTEEYNLEKMPTCIALIDSNQIFTIVEDGLGIYDFRNRSYNYVKKINAEKVRFNDGKCDRNGILHIGTMDRSEKEYIGSIYRYQNNELTEIISNIGISNGISFSSDNNTMYYSDSLRGTIYKRVNDQSGNIHTNIVHTYNVEGSYRPDGSTIDTDDKYYSCVWGGSRIDIFNSDALEKFISLDVKYPTCCCFGGNDMNRLFITSASLLDRTGNNGYIDIINMSKYKGVFEHDISY